MPDISNLTNQVRQNIAEQQKFRSELENDGNKLNNNVSGALTSQINQLDNAKSKQGTVILDLGKDLEKATDDVEREKVSGELKDATDFMRGLDDDLEKLNNKNNTAQSLSHSINTGTKLQNEFKPKSTSAKDGDAVKDDRNSAVKEQPSATTMEEMSSELSKSKGILNKIINGGQ